MGAEGSGNWKRTFAVLWICVFLVCASYTMVVPFLPLFLVQDLALPAANAKMWSGVILAVTFVLAGIMAPYWGARGDVTGQKVNAIRAGIGLTMCYAMTSVVTGPWQLLGVRIFMGLISGFVPACMSMASFILPEERLGWGMGLIQTANSSGNIMGPLLGGLLSSVFGMRMSFMVAAVSLALATLSLVILVPKDKPKNLEGEAPKSLEMFRQLGEMLTHRSLLGILALFSLVKACLMVAQPLLTIYVNELLDGSPAVVTVSGFILSLAGIAGIVAAPFWGTQGHRYGCNKILALVFVCAGIMDVGQLLGHNIWLFGVLYFVYGLFNAGTAPNLYTRMTQETAAAQRGKAFGLATAADQLGGALGPLAGGFLGAFLSINQILALTGLVLIAGGLEIYWTKVRKAEVT